MIDSNHTFPRFSYNHLGYSKQLSHFDKTTGTLVFDREAKTGSADITIDMKSVDTGSPIFNEHIQREDFLDTEKYPTATFKSTKVIFKDNQPISLDGTLTIKGISKPITLKIDSFQLMPHPILPGNFDIEVDHTSGLDLAWHRKYWKNGCNYSAQPF